MSELGKRVPDSRRDKPERRDKDHPFFKMPGAAEPEAAPFSRDRSEGSAGAFVANAGGGVKRLEAHRVVDEPERAALDEEPESPGAVGRFMNELVKSGVEEVAWWAAECVAEVHAPGAGRSLVRLIRGLQRAYLTFAALEHADGVRVEVPVGSLTGLPVDLGLRATYSDGPDAGRFILGVSGSVNLDGPAKPGVPTIGPAETAKHVRRRYGSAASDRHESARVFPRGEQDEQDHRAKPRPDRESRNPWYEQTVPVAGEPVRLVAVAGSVIVSDSTLRAVQAAHARPETEDPDERSVVGGRLAAQASSVAGSVGSAVTDPQRVMLLVVDVGADGSRKGALFYKDPHGWFHLVAVLFVVDRRLIIFVATT